MEPSADHRRPDLPTAAGWATFQDSLEATIARLRPGAELDLVDSSLGPPWGWRIRITAGWPGVQGPGTHAYKLELGADGGSGTLMPWATTPAARRLGFGATATACAVADLALVASDAGPADPEPDGAVPNPCHVAVGRAGVLEIADLAVELVHDAFRVERPGQIRVSGDPQWPGTRSGPGRSAGSVGSVGSAQGVQIVTDSPMPADRGQRCWRELNFTEEPLQDPGGDHLVGAVGDVLVEVEHDRDSVPGLVLTMVRGRLSDTAEVPLVLPPGERMEVPTAGPGAGLDLVAEPVRVGGSDWHVWLHHTMVTTAGAPSDPAVPSALLAAAVTGVAEAVRSARRDEPRTCRPLRQVSRPA